MTIEQQVVEKLRDLPPEKQKEVSREAASQLAGIVVRPEHPYHGRRHSRGTPRNVGKIPARFKFLQ